MAKIYKIPDWLIIALQELQADIDEIPGPRHEARIVEYHQSCDLKAQDDEIPWCSAYVNWVMQKAGYSGTRSAAAASWRQWGKELEDGAQRLGCIVVMTRAGGNHVGFYLDEDDSGIYVLGGNQANQVCIRRYAWDTITNFRWPTNYVDQPA